MPLGDEYDLSPVTGNGREDVRDVYEEAVDASWMQEIEAGTTFLRTAYDRWPTIPTYEATPRNQYMNARNVLRESGTRYTKDALALFAATADFERSPTAVKPGIFLSAAVTELEADHVILPDLSGVDYCVYRNEADVTVDGDVGDYAGHSMLAGSLTVEGDTGTHCGRFMEDGSITIRGDAGRALGHGMQDGSIHVHGDVDDFAGLDRKGGTITVEGETGRPPLERADGSRAGTMTADRPPA